MVKRSAFVAGLLTLAYAAFLSVARVQGGEGISQFQHNTVVAERYVFGDAAWTEVIAGSSMSVRLLPDYLPATTYNLALSGGSALTGLSLIRDRASVPRVVYVEMSDTLLKGRDEKLLAELRGPYRKAVGRSVPATREEYHPTVVLFDKLKAVAKGRQANEDAGGPAPNFASILATAVAGSQTPPKASAVKQCLEAVEEDIADLRHRGARIVLFRPPNDPALERSPAISAFNRAVDQAFPRDKYDWLVADQRASFQTADGTHLLPSSARRYAKLFWLEGASQQSALLKRGGR